MSKPTLLDNFSPSQKTAAAPQPKDEMCIAKMAIPVSFLAETCVRHNGFVDAF